MTKLNLKKGDIGETDEENEQAIAKLEKAEAKTSPKNARQAKLVRKNSEGETLSEESVPTLTSDTNEFTKPMSSEEAHRKALESYVPTPSKDQQRIWELEKQLAEANARAKKPARTAKPKMTEEEKEARRLARENELAQQRAKAMIELAEKAKRIQSELVEQLHNPCSLEQLQDILAYFVKQVRTSKPSKSASEGSTIAKNGVVYKPASEWKPTHHLEDSEVLAIVARAREMGYPEKPINKSALGREFDSHPAMIGNILTGEYYSKVTGIVFQAKGDRKV